MRSQPVYIALGSNLGDRRANLSGAICLLRHKVGIEHVSALYETEPAYVTDQPRFLNLVLRGNTTLDPHALLRFLKSIEQQMGRETGLRYGPRLIDLDILLYGNLRIDEPDLQIPHPRMAERHFVLAPLAEIAPGLVLPGFHDTVAILAATIQGQGAVVRVEPL